jgi:hypothetical protein
MPEGRCAGLYGQRADIHPPDTRLGGERLAANEGALWRSCVVAIAKSRCGAMWGDCVVAIAKVRCGAMWGDCANETEQPYSGEIFIFEALTNLGNLINRILEGKR